MHQIKGKRQEMPNWQPHFSGLGLRRRQTKSKLPTIDSKRIILRIVKNAKKCAVTKLSAVNCGTLTSLVSILYVKYSAMSLQAPYYITF